MRPLTSLFRGLTKMFLTILLMSAIWSCRSAKQSFSQSADSTAVVASEVKASMSAEEILSLVKSSADIHLSGITVEFFPPDTAHPDARAAPKSLKIDNAKANRKSDASTHKVAASVEKDTVNVNLSESSASAQSTRSDTKILSPTEWVFLSILPIAVIAIIIILIFIYKRKKHDSLL